MPPIIPIPVLEVSHALLHLACRRAGHDARVFVFARVGGLSCAFLWCIRASRALERLLVFCLLAPAAAHMQQCPRGVLVSCGRVDNENDDPRLTSHVCATTVESCTQSAYRRDL